MRISKIKNKIKPDESKSGLITNEISKISNVPADKIPLTLLKSALEQGRTVVIDEFHDNRTADNFDGTYFIGLDIDYVTQTINMTKDVLKSYGINYHILYKTFSYTRHHQKHRVLVKFDRLLSRDEAMTIYQFFGSILPVDSSTKSNLVRLWHGTNHDIDDCPGNVLNADEFLNQHCQDIHYTNYDDILANMHYDFIIKDFDSEAFYQEVKLAFDDWEYNTIRTGVYSASIIYRLQTGEDDALDIFFELLEDYRPDKVKLFKTYLNHDLSHEKIYYSLGISILQSVATVIANKVDNIYDILHNVEFKHLKDNEFITEDDIESLITGNSLLVSPAGSGKTTAMINWCHNRSTTNQCVIIVPTIAIAKQLHIKYNDYDNFEFLYSENGDTITKTTEAINNVCTYDSYYYNEWDDDHVLFIDEAHELVSFYSIKGKQDIIGDILLNAHKHTTIFITATPFNLADNFNKKLFFTKDSNKDYHIVVSKNVKSGLNNVVLNNLGKRILIYINSNNKIKSYKEFLNNEYPELKIGIVTSKNRDDTYEDIINNNELSVDIVLSTKFINIGVDVQGLFDVVIYGNSTIYANDLLQLFNRERQASRFYCIIKDGSESKGLNVNTMFTKYHSRYRGGLSKADLKLLDYKFTDGVYNPHLITSEVFYKTSKLNRNHIYQLFKMFYPNFDETYLLDMTESIYSDEVRMIDDVFDEYFRWCEDDTKMIERNLKRYLIGDQVEFTPDITYGGVKFIYRFYNLIRRNLDSIVDGSLNDYFTYNSNNDMIEFTNPSSTHYYHLGDKTFINYIEDDNMRDTLLSVLSKPEYKDSDKDIACFKLNNSGAFVDNKLWNTKNFIKFAKRFNVSYKSKLYYDEDKNKKRKWILQTKFIEDLIQDTRKETENE